MIITCPNCQTSYNIADAALSSAGRKVQCAHCQKTWRATQSAPAPAPAPQPKPQLKTVGDNTRELAENLDQDQDLAEDLAEDLEQDLNSEEESALDDAFEQAAQAGAEKAPAKKKTAPKDKGKDKKQSSKRKKSNPGAAGDDGEMGMDLQRRREQDMDARLQSLKKKLPLARLIRVFRFISVVIFVVVMGGAVYMREELVRLWPDLGGLYDKVGLGVNVYGLEIGEAQTLRSVREDGDSMLITAKIRNLSRTPTAIPPVRVSILNRAGESLYEWNAEPDTDLIGPGEVVSLQTQLSSAPHNAAQVQLAFVQQRKSKDSK